MTKVRI